MTIIEQKVKQIQHLNTQQQEELWNNCNNLLWNSLPSFWDIEDMTQKTKKQRWTFLISSPEERWQMTSQRDTQDRQHIHSLSDIMKQRYNDVLEEVDHLEEWNADDLLDNI